VIYDEDPYVTWARQQALVPMPQQIVLPGELAKADPSLPPPPPPPPPQRMMAPGVPVQDEVPQGAVPEQAAPERPPPMQVDAVSQAAPAAQVNDIANVSMEQPQPPPPDVYGGGQVEGQAPDAYLQHMQQVANDESLPSARDHITEDATARAVNAMSPEQLAQYNAHRESAMVLEQARLQHEAELENQRRQAESSQIQQAATAKADADMQDVLTRAHDLSVSSVNPERYKAQRGTGGTIRDMAMLFFSGLGGNADGAMRVLDSRIARDIDSQTTAINNGWKGVDVSRNEIAQEYARHGDLYRAAETVRLAKYQSMLNDIQSQMQLYDPAGSSALRGRAAMDQLQAQMTQAKQALWQQSFKNTLDYMKGEAEYNEKMANIAKTQAETAKLKGQLGGAAKVKPVKFEDVPRTAEQLRQLGVQIPKEVTLPPEGLSLSQAQKIAATAKGVEEWQKASTENKERSIGGVASLALDESGKPKVDFNGKPVMKYDHLKNDDGTDFQPQTKEEALALRKKTAAVNTIQSLMADTIMLRKKYGWSSDLLKSPEWQKMKANWSTILVKQKDLQELGAISESDLKLISGLMGAKDPTQYQDPEPGMIQAFDNTELAYNSDLRPLGYTGPDLHRARPWELPEAEATPEEKSVQAVTAFDPQRSITAKDMQDLRIDLNAPQNHGGGLTTAINEALAREGGVPPRIKAQINALRDMTNDADPKKREFATQALKNISTDALDPNVKAYATANAFDPAAIAAPNLTKEEAR
jgi:hypothetical protein